MFVFVCRDSHAPGSHGYGVANTHGETVAAGLVVKNNTSFKHVPNNENFKRALLSQVLIPTTVALVQNPVSIKREPNLRSRDPEGSGGPTTTVFVGNISEKASDMLVRQLLAVSFL